MGACYPMAHDRTGRETKHENRPGAAAAAASVSHGFQFLDGSINDFHEESLVIFEAEATLSAIPSVTTNPGCCNTFAPQGVDGGILTIFVPNLIP
jgi:hypothetical protein